MEEKRLAISSLEYGISVQSTPKPNSLSDLYMDLRKKLIDDEQRLIELKLEIKKYIDLLENPLHKLIMTERYINLKSFERIAVDNHYSYKYLTNKLHPKALKAVKEVAQGCIVL